MTLRDLVALGIVQCVNWGVLYYAFGVLLLPLHRDLGAPQAAVAGALSAGLLVSALAAPAVGRRCDSGGGPLLLRGGALASAVLLWVLALVPHVATLYAVWIGLGLCMAAVLYEPAFAIVGRSVGSPRQRLRALSIVTVFGGLASTVFLPITALLLERSSWRWTVATLGVLMVLSSVTAAAIRPAGAATIEPDATRLPSDAGPHALTSRLRAVTTTFSVASFSAAAFTATAVTAFVDRGLSAQRAALLAGVFGLMQLPGRIVLMTGRIDNPPLLAAICLATQAAGLAVVAAAPPALIAVGVAIFAVGHGAMTLVRPHLVHTAFGLARAGALNGAIARSQQLARAAGPFAAALAAGAFGYRAAFALLAAATTALAAWWWFTIAVPTRTTLEEAT